jgi:hypothetical protein
MAGPEIRESVTVAGRAERARIARAFAVGVLGPGHPCGDDAALLVSELFGKILAEYARHYNGHRPHQGLQQESPQRPPGHALDITAKIERRQVLSGLISEYRRAA